jgi:hypothetical protein
MKHLAFLVLATFAAAAIAQEKPAAAPEAAKEPAKEATKPAPTKSAASSKKGPRRWNEDARHCLEKTSNTEVIKCAEEFL